MNEEESTGSHNHALLGQTYIGGQHSEHSQMHRYQVVNQMINKDIEKQKYLEKNTNHLEMNNDEQPLYKADKASPHLRQGNIET